MDRYNGRNEVKWTGLTCGELLDLWRAPDDEKVKKRWGRLAWLLLLAAEPAGHSVPTTTVASFWHAGRTGHKVGRLAAAAAAQPRLLDGLANDQRRLRLVTLQDDILVPVSGRIPGTGDPRRFARVRCSWAVGRRAHLLVGVADLVLVPVVPRLPGGQHGIGAGNVAGLPEGGAGMAGQGGHVLAALGFEPGLLELIDGHDRGYVRASGGVEVDGPLALRTGPALHGRAPLALRTVHGADGLLLAVSHHSPMVERKKKKRGEMIIQPEAMATI